MNISKRKIDLLMASRGISLVALSKISGISRQNLSTIKLRGTCRPETAAKLARGLGVEVIELVE